jgi:murein DD-endopeptidase MepM/ murein hydrolase activator NlpD
MRFKIFLLIFFGSIQFCFTQGKVENATNNSNSNSAPVLFEMNTISNSNSAIPTIQDTIQVELDDNDSFKESSKKEESKKVKTKQQKAASVALKDKSILEKNEASASTMEVLNQNFSSVYDEIRMQGNQRNPTAEQQEELNKTLQTIETIDSNSFDYHIMKVKAGNYEVNNFYHLAKANELNALNIEVQRQLLAYYTITADTTSMKLTLDNQFKNKQIPTEHIDYGSDVINSLPLNSTVITHSFDDSYSVLFHQLSNQERQDVTVINLDFCQSKNYRDLLVKKGYQIAYDGKIDTKFLADFVVQNPSKNINLAMTLPKDYFLNQTEALAICGLVFTPGNEMSLEDFNQSLWETRLSKKVLFTETELGKRLSKNYLPLLLDLSQYYQEKNQLDKKREIDDWITKIGKKTNVSDQLKKLKD